jgi:hypothetical protein
MTPKASPAIFVRSSECRLSSSRCAPAVAREEVHDTVAVAERDAEPWSAMSPPVLHALGVN